MLRAARLPGSVTAALCAVRAIVAPAKAALRWSYTQPLFKQTLFLGKKDFTSFWNKKFIFYFFWAGSLLMGFG
ncbi:MAG: hypothetical protein OM95_00720 [Bdellovibrio sp. ArHS]|uniref:hypothetical protein n=1 Tax=Bdellovibrio sp. ArHS TaxID=1569284 RepID=UPI000582FAD7|nr:hypothetical protein [Bdellovibrio sp. ArHS]KHD89930.1 MAG: hypothetical protein OM95_00720 [Bdellovibrio sp. ArHS]